MELFVIFIYCELIESIKMTNELMTPKIIHHIVGDKRTELIEECLQSWAKLEEYGFEIKIWTDASLAAFIRKNYRFALAAFLNARNHAEAADIARYLVVHKYGGYYVDWDILLFNYPDFLELSETNENGYLVVDQSNDTIASEHFSAPVQEKYLFFLVKDIVHTFNRGERELMWTPQYSGPYRMKTSYERFAECQQDLIHVKDIFEYDYTEIRTATVYGEKQIMIHFWMHSWLEKS